MAPAGSAGAGDSPVLTPARLRIGIVGAIAVVLAFAAGDIFDLVLWPAVPAAAIPVLVALAVASCGAVLRIGTAVVAVAASLVLTVTLAGGGTSDVFDAVTSGLQRTLTTDWPSPDRPDLVGMAGFFVALAAAIAADLAGRRRWHLVPLVPLVVVHVGIVALSAPIGVRLRWVVLNGVLAMAFATLRTDVGREQLSLLRGERRVLPLGMVALGIAAAMSLPLDLVPRADPRRNDPPELTAPLIDPIEATLALRAQDPPLALHQLSIEGDTVPPSRWRTAALETYDGERWTPDLTLRPLGRRLGPAGPDTIGYTVRFLDDDLSLVPLAGSPVTVDAPIETDEQRTIVRLVERPDPADEIAVTSNIAPTVSDAIDGAIATRPVDENVSGLTELAESLAGESGTVLERLQAIEQVMRNDFVLETDAPGGGLQRALIDRFLRDTQRGNSEQFTTAFVLLARSIGVDARVATGFELESAPTSGVVTLSSSEAAIWPEVQLVDGGWFSFDPTPAEEVSDVAEPPVEPQVQTPAAPQPPVLPPPEPSNETPEADEATENTVGGALNTAVVWLVRIAAVSAGLLIPILLLAAGIAAAKFRRRRRRLHAAEPVARIRGAWAVATDALVDAGMTIEPAATDVEIARDGEELVPTATPELHRLATMSSAATFGTPTRPDLLADDAANCLGQVESSMSSELGRWQRLQWRFSARSLRRRTRSPVSD